VTNCNKGSSFKSLAVTVKVPRAADEGTFIMMLND
jgi:hypothetical protein